MAGGTENAVEDAAAAISRGEFVVVVDDESRENEGDLIMAAEFATAQQVAFMVAHTNGLLCVPMTESRARELELPMMVPENRDRNQTAFAVTCDAAVGTTTGASASDRALSTRVLAGKTTKPSDLNRPGHILPLVARNGGVLARGGHTEAAVDLCFLAGCMPVALICELMHADGTMMRRPGCTEFAQRHGLKILTTAQIASFRRNEQAAAWPPRSVVSQPAISKDILRRCDDNRFMRLALATAARGRYSAPPNPWVGCVLVSVDGEVIGSGFHARAGGPHAEIEALSDARSKRPDAISGCTAYVTLEPCHHQGRTGPCDAALVSAGVSRVVVCLEDPDPRVSGQGVALLRKSGIKVDVGICRSEGLALLAPYIAQRTRGTPHVVLKAAVSLDGKVACPDGTSQWITGPEARADSHLLRAASQAIIVGSGTASMDQPRLTTRLEKLPLGVLPPSAPPLRVVLDARGTVTAGPLLNTSEVPTLIFTTADASPSARKIWETAKVEVCTVRHAHGSVGVDLKAVLAELGRRQILQVMVEGGSIVHSSFLEDNFVDELRIYKGSTILGEGGRPWISAPLAATIGDARFWTLRAARVVGSDVAIEYEVAPAMVAPAQNGTSKIKTMHSAHI